MTEEELRRALRAVPSWRTLVIEAASTSEGLPGDEPAPKRHRMWIDRHADRWRSEGEREVRVVDGIRWWVRWSPDGPVVHYDGTGTPSALGAPFVASMVRTDDLVDDDIELHMVRTDEWIQRRCVVVHVASRTQESGTLPTTLDVVGAEACWICDRYELWLDVEHGFVLRLRAFVAGELYVERRVLAIEVDAPVSSSLFTYELPSGVRLIDAGHTPPWEW